MQLQMPFRLDVQVAQGVCLLPCGDHPEVEISAEAKPISTTLLGVR